MRQRPQNSDSDQKFFRLLNESCLVKTMENLRRRKKLIMVKDEKPALFFCIKFNFSTFKIFKEKLIAVTLIKKSINWNKPTYLGAAASFEAASVQISF